MSQILLLETAAYLHVRIKTLKLHNGLPCRSGFGWPKLGPSTQGTTRIGRNNTVNDRRLEGTAHAAGSNGKHDASPVGQAARLAGEWATSPRWRGIKRSYSAEDVIRLRGSVQEEHTLARLGAERLWTLLHTEDFVPSLGALTGNQAVQMVKAGLPAIYLSGWQVAADANLAGSTYPDQSLYPANSVPQVVRRLNNALMRADQIDWSEGRNGTDWLAPIVADAEAGFGDALNATLLTSDVDELDAPFVTGSRTAEGFYRVTDGLDAAIARSLAYAPYADVLWFETSTPDLGEAREFAQAIHERHPRKLLAYNCSPSFNWRKALSDEQIASFQQQLGAWGYRFQFITLAGFHSLNAGMFELARGYRDRGMSAYVELQEREFAMEREGYTATRHQREVGAGYFDQVMQAVSKDSSTLALKGSTEEAQFA